jgi:hypothetical protein
MSTESLTFEALERAGIDAGAVWDAAYAEIYEALGRSHDFGTKEHFRKELVRLNRLHAEYFGPEAA